MNTIDNNPHPSNLVQAGLAGLMTLNNNNSLLNVTVATVAGARGEVGVGETVGTATGPWGVIGVGINSGMGTGGYSMPGQDSTGRSPVEAPEITDGEN